MSKKKQKKALRMAAKAMQKRRKNMKRRMTLRVMGISIISAAVLMGATKKLFDEIFVGDDWSDVDWGEENEDYGVGID